LGLTRRESIDAGGHDDTALVEQQHEYGCSHLPTGLAQQLEHATGVLAPLTFIVIAPRR
jgi:hypothetical protein